MNFLIEKKLLGEEMLINYKKNNRFRETIEMVNLAIKEDGSRTIIGENYVNECIKRL